jgi:hypothetical protein
MTFYIKQNDTSPSLRAALKDGDNLAIDLTGATVRFHMKSLEDNTVVVDADATVVVPSVSGIVQYDWDNGDTATAGSYQGEFEVTFAGGAIETFPNKTNISISIKPELN